MIHVDVVVPDVDETYEFCCDETMSVSVLIRQMQICVEKAEDIRNLFFTETPWLFCKERETDLNPEGSLFENGVTNGMTLLLL